MFFKKLVIRFLHKCFNILFVFFSPSRKGGPCWSIKNVAILPVGQQEKFSFHEDPIYLQQMCKTW